MSDHENENPQPDDTPDLPPSVEMLLGALFEGGDKIEQIGDARVIKDEDIPAELKDMLMKFIMSKADNEVEERIEKAELKLDGLMMDYREALTPDEDGPGMKPYQATAALGYHLGEQCDMPRSLMSILFAVAIAKLTRLEDRNTDLELTLAGYQAKAA